MDMFYKGVCHQRERRVWSMPAGVRPQSERRIQWLHISKSQHGTRIYVSRDATGLEYA